MSLGTDCMIKDPRIREQAIDWLLHIKGNTCARCGNPLPPNPHDPTLVDLRSTGPRQPLFRELELVHVSCETATEGAQAPESTQLGLDL